MLAVIPNVQNMAPLWMMNASVSMRKAGKGLSVRRLDVQALTRLIAVTEVRQMPVLHHFKLDFLSIKHL